MRAVVGAVLGVTVLGGCATLGADGGEGGPGAGGATASVAEAAARATVLQLARDITSKHPHIDDYARAADERIGDAGTTSIIGLEERPDAAHGDPFGRLTFLVPGDSFDTDDEGPYCYWVDFSYFGYVGDWETGDGVHGQDCPADAAPVVIPIDTTVREVVASNASEAAHLVLADIGPDAPSAAEVEAAIAALLIAPEAEFTVTAPPHAVVQGSSIGVAMGAADDCVLVSWIDGVSADVSVPRVLLQPGELGCQATTAIASPDQLRSPH